MKYLETKFEEYMLQVNNVNLHPYIDKKYKDLYSDPSTQHLIFYGPPGIGKYTQALKYIAKFSATDLKYERKIILISNKKEYNFKISDIHFEIDMGILGCNAKLLWNDFYYNVVDIIYSRPGYRGIILCKNFHKIHSELLDIFFSYMQSSSYKNIDLKYIIITEAIGFIPDNITERVNIVKLKRPSRNQYNKIIKTKIPNSINIDNIINIKNITNNIYNLQEPHKKICEKLITVIDNYNDISFLNVRDIIYELFIYQLDIYNSMWYIISHYIETKQFNQINGARLIHYLHIILKYFNNNYRPIYHIERFIYILSRTVNDL